MIEEILRELGVRVTSVSGDEIQGYCPVHALVEGTDQSKPKWYINAESGAWICFTCGQRGSLPHLVEALGGDADTIEKLKLSAALSITQRWHEDDEGTVIDKDEPVVDPDLFDANPPPPVRMLDLKDVDPAVAERYNVRWDAKGKCFMLPIYSADNRLLGWQEKSKGYFMNVPKRVHKAESLFGWHTYREGALIVVESPLDALRFASHGYAAVATYGSFISELQALLITRADQAILAFDNDDAGDHAMDQAAVFLREWDTNASFRFFNYPPGTRGSDPGELPVTALHSGVAHATPWFTHSKKEQDNGNTKPRRPPRRTVRSLW